MTFWTEPPIVTQSAQESDWLDPTLVQYLTAAAEDADQSGPTASLGRLAQLAASASQITGITTEEDESGATVAVVGQPTAEPVPIEEQTARIKAAGLEGQVKANPGYTSAALDTIIDWKSDELQRKAIRDAAPAAWGVLGMGAELVESMLDPIAFASAFLPVVPAARAASMLESAGGAAGRAAVRAKVGALEGGLGALAVEPFVYLGQSQSQADYTMMDSLQNAAFGIIMGAGFQAAGGAIADKILRGKTRGTADATAAAELADAGESELAGADLGTDSAPPLVSGAGGTVDGGTVTVAVPRQRNLKIPGRADEPYEYALMEADDLQSSHIPEAGFQPNPRYELENERRYHAEAASQRKVLDNAAQLDPESVDSKTARTAGKSRGDRLGGRTLDALAVGMRDADSLRQFFDAPESREVVDMLISDGVIREQDRNAFVNADGLLTNNGKRAVERALRGMVVNDYKTLSALPKSIINKIDASIPHLLASEMGGGDWNITQDFRDGIDLLAEFYRSGKKDVEAFLFQPDKVKGVSPSERYSEGALSVFNLLRNSKKAKLVTALQRNADYAKLSAESGTSPDAAVQEYLGFSMEDADMKLRAAMGELLDRRTDPVDPPAPIIDTAAKGELEQRMDREAAEYDRALQDAAGFDPELAKEVSEALNAELSELDADISRARQERDVAVQLAACEANL